MTDYTSLQAKVNDLKAKVDSNSISPSYVGALLDDFISIIKSSDQEEDVAAALQDAATALTLARSSSTKADNARATANAAKAVTDTKGAPNGIASLDGEGRIPLSQLPVTAVVALPFDGTVEDVAIYAESPVTSEAIDALKAGNLAVVFDTGCNKFRLCMSAGDAPAIYFSSWIGLVGSGKELPGASEYVNGTIFLNTQNDAYYTRPDSVSALRLLGSVSEFEKEFRRNGALTGGVTVEHKANSVKVCIPKVAEDGSHSTEDAVIGAVGVKAGLMLPKHVAAILENGVAIQKSLAAFDEVKKIVADMANLGAPLPFGFYNCGEDGVIFNGELFVDNTDTPIPAEDNTYNELTEDGELRASTKRHFKCGRQTYRFTGRELINVAVEANPDQRLIRHAPPLKARPGLAYANRGIIKLPMPTGDTPSIVSLEGMYFHFSGTPKEEMRPLSSFDIIYNQDAFTLERDGDWVTLSLRKDWNTALPGEDGYDPDINRSPYAYIVVDESKYRGLSGDENEHYNSYIGVRYIAGKKVFYDSQQAFAMPIYKPSITRLRKILANCITFHQNDSGHNSCILEGANCCYKKAKIQVWTKTAGRLLWRDDAPLLNHPRVRKWRWKSVPPKKRYRTIYHKTCLVRIKLRASNSNVWSDWFYFHCSPFESEPFTLSRQKKT